MSTKTRRSRPYRRHLASVANNVTNKKVVLRTITEMDDEDGSYCSAGATSDPKIETMDVRPLEAALGAIDAGDLRALELMTGSSPFVLFAVLAPLGAYGLGTLDAGAARTDILRILERGEGTAIAANAAIDDAIGIMGHVRGTGMDNVNAVIDAMNFASLRYRSERAEEAVASAAIVSLGGPIRRLYFLTDMSFSMTNGLTGLLANYVTAVFNAEQTREAVIYLLRVHQDLTGTAFDAVLPVLQPLRGTAHVNAFLRALRAALPQYEVEFFQREVAREAAAEAGRLREIAAEQARFVAALAVPGAGGRPNPELFNIFRARLLFQPQRILNLREGPDALSESSGDISSVSHSVGLRISSESADEHETVARIAIGTGAEHQEGGGDQADGVAEEVDQVPDVAAAADQVAVAAAADREDFAAETKQDDADEE